MVAQRDAAERRPILQILPVPGEEGGVRLQRAAPVNRVNQPREIDGPPFHAAPVLRGDALDPQRRQVAPGAVHVVAEDEGRHAGRLRGRCAGRKGRHGAARDLR